MQKNRDYILYIFSFFFSKIKLLKITAVKMN